MHGAHIRKTQQQFERHILGSATKDKAKANDICDAKKDDESD